MGNTKAPKFESPLEDRTITIEILPKVRNSSILDRDESIFMSGVSHRIKLQRELDMKTQIVGGLRDPFLEYYLKVKKESKANARILAKQLQGFLEEELGLKEGGRVKFAEGTEVEDDIITSNVSFGSGSATTSEPVQQLSYEQLRDRLPPEITDDVVNLLANNAEALQQFAYIRTQEDVNAFNVKYGVNLVIPPTRT